MAGLAKICKQFGRMKIGDTMMVWDYAQDKAVPESEMPFGSERHKQSERAKWGKIKTETGEEMKKDEP